MHRAFESAAYAVAAILIVGGALYGLARYSEGDAPPPAPAPTAAAAPRAVPRPLPSVPPPSSSTPAYRPSISENVVRTKDRVYFLPPAPANPQQADVETYNALRRNCYEAAGNNRYGEYPAMQQSACTRYSEFARQRGWDTGALPAYAQRQPQARTQVAYDDGGDANNNAAECRALLDEEHSIQAQMRAGYQEPWGNWYRQRLWEIDQRQGQLHCPVR